MKGKKFAISFMIVLTILVIIGVAVSCSMKNGCGNSQAREGYKLALEDIKIGLIVPNSLEVDEVYCYETVIEKRAIRPVDYVYKISFSCENGIGMRVNYVAYYGYLEYSSYVVDYGQDSSVFNTESSIGKKINIRK